MSPEYPDSVEFVRRVVDSGVRVAIGHTSANSAQIRGAVDAGASMSTHLGNGTHASLQRHPNYVWDQMAEDRLVASLIADGHHLPPAVVKSLVRAKSPERVILISDITGLATHSGTAPGPYANPCLGAVEVLDSGCVVVAGQRQYLAGAILPLRIGVANVMRFAQVDLATAINMASVRPAQVLGLQQDHFASGMKADLIQFEMSEGEHGSIRILATFNAGQCVYGTPTEM
jgi:N-acetylglucosamine-6-phosphate deacetylase